MAKKWEKIVFMNTDRIRKTNIVKKKQKCMCKIYRKNKAEIEDRKKYDDEQCA